MTKTNVEWIDHDGGPMPMDVTADMMVSVKFRAHPNMEQIGRAYEFFWNYSLQNESEHIVAYRKLNEVLVEGISDWIEHEGETTIAKMENDHHNVLVKLRNGTYDSGSAQDMRWGPSKNPKFGSEYEIVAYRILETQP